MVKKWVNRWILIGTVAGLLFADQLTKWVVTEFFSLGESRVVIPGFFSLTYVRNTGAAFGVLAQADPSIRTPIFILIPIVALVVIAFVYRKLTAADRKLAVALSLIISGAVGNLLDRLRLDYVIDFLDFHWRNEYHFPAFNIADMSICVGVGLLLLDLFSENKTETQ